MSAEKVIKTSAFEIKRLLDEATRLQVEGAESFEGLIALQPDKPLWPIIAKMQRMFADEKYRQQHPDYVVSGAKAEGSVAGVWYSQVRGEKTMFLSVQQSDREVPVLHQIGESGIIDEILAMIQDINSNDTGAAAMLVAEAFTAFKEAGFLIIAVDGDPDENTYMLQAYTKDRKYLMDIQLDYFVIQEDIHHQEMEANGE